MTITVEIRTVYGIDKVYPVCEKAKLFAAMTHTATLTDHSISCIKKLGYEIQVKQRPTTL